MKTMLSAVILIIVFLFSAVSVSAATSIGAKTDINIYMGERGYSVNGQYERFDVAPYQDTTEWRSMVAARPIAEALGASVTWLDSAKELIIQYKGKTIKVVQDTPLQDGMGTPRLINDRFMIPVRYLCEQMDLTVGWAELDQSNEIIEQQ